MSVSQFILLVWVFLVSIWARGWVTGVALTTFIFFVGIAYIVARLLEFFGILGAGFAARTRRSTTNGAEG